DELQALDRAAGARGGGRVPKSLERGAAIVRYERLVLPNRSRSEERRDRRVFADAQRQPVQRLALALTRARLGPGAHRPRRAEPRDERPGLPLLFDGEDRKSVV